MRIAIQTLGTRGDVQPFVALGRRLAAAGFAVSLAADPRFEALVAGHGLAFEPLPGDLLDLMGTPDGRAAVSGGKLAATARLLRGMRPMFRRLLDAQRRAARGADAILCHPKAVGGLSIAEALGIPGFLALPAPALSPTAAFPSPLLPVGDLGPLNRASHALATRFGDLAFRGALARWREEALGLDGRAHWLSLRGRPAPRIYPCSRVLVPPPADWGPESTVTGPWFLPEEPGWTAPPELRAFLEAGPPPVYVGFGSLPSEDARAMTELVAGALARAGVRGILATGWGGLAGGPTPPGMLAIEGAPHGWLFPRTAAVVHHGGAGTTAAGLLAGRPTLVCPVFGDQPFWGRRVHALGAGPAPIPRRRLTVERLAAAIREMVERPDIRARAAEIGAAMGREDGVGEAAALIAGALGAGPGLTHVNESSRSLGFNPPRAES